MTAPTATTVTGLSLFVICLGIGCAAPEVVSPDTMIRTWQTALRNDDAAAVHALLSRAGKRTHNIESVKQRLRLDGQDIEKIATQMVTSQAQTVVTAQITGSNGWLARLVLEGQDFRVAAAGSLPASAHRPEEALAQLLVALRHRSHASLLRVLTQDASQAMERDITSLVAGLAESEMTSIVVHGREAKVTLSGGHTITLERENGSWKVKYFD